MKTLIIASLFLSLINCTIHAQVESAELEKNVVVANAAQNRLYMGVSNPIDIAIIGYGGKNIIATIDTSIGTIEGKAGHYMVTLKWSNKPYSNCLIKVSAKLANGKIKYFGSATFHIVMPPDPNCYVYNKKGYFTISKEDLARATQVQTRLEWMDIDVAYTVTHYEMVIHKKDGTLIEKSNDGRDITPEMKQLIRQLESGDRVVIQNVNVHGPDTRVIWGCYITIE